MMVVYEASALMTLCADVYVERTILFSVQTSDAVAHYRDKGNCHAFPRETLPPGYSLAVTAPLTSLSFRT